MVDQPYDWDDYASDWHSSPAYEAQEAALRRTLRDLRTDITHSRIESILEVGPGFGRVTRLVLDVFPEFREPDSVYGVLDISASAMEQAQLAAGRELCPRIAAPIQTAALRDLFASSEPCWRDHAHGHGYGSFGLVLAVEVLLHIPPHEVMKAVTNLLAAVSHGGNAAPGRDGNGVLVTCDWTVELPRRADGSPTPIRVQNWRHDYMTLFHRAGASEITREGVGLQSIFTVRP